MSTYATRLVHNPSCPYSELGLSFVFDQCGKKATIFLLCGCFDRTFVKQQIDFVYAIDNQRFESRATLMKGCQMATLDKVTTERLFEALMQGKTVAINASNHITVINPCQFAELYKQRYGWKNCLPRMMLFP